MGKKKAVNEVLIYINQYIFRKKRTISCITVRFSRPFPIMSRLRAEGTGSAFVTHWNSVSFSSAWKQGFFAVKTSLVWEQNKPCLRLKEGFFWMQWLLLQKVLLVSAGNYPLLLTFGTSRLVESARVSFGQGTVPRRGKLVLLAVVWMCKSSFAEHALCLIAVLLAIENGARVNSFNHCVYESWFFFFQMLCFVVLL